MAFTRQEKIEGAKLGETLSLYGNGKTLFKIKEGEEDNIFTGRFVSINSDGEVIPYDGASALGIATYDFSAICGTNEGETLLKENKVVVGLGGAFIAEPLTGETFVKGKGFDIDASGKVKAGGTKGAVVETYQDGNVAVYYSVVGLA